MAKLSKRNSNASISESNPQEVAKSVRDVMDHTPKQRRSSSIYGSYERPNSLLNDTPSKNSTSLPVISPNSSYAEIERYVLSLSKSAVNQKDIFGRTLLHLAASNGQYDFIEALLKHPHIDLTTQDYENGWTALHRAICSGHILGALMLLEKNYDSIAIRDRCKQRPFDLLSISPPPTLPLSKTWTPSIGGSHLLSFGSNTNHTLGFADPDDRAFPQVVELQRNNELYLNAFSSTPSTENGLIDDSDSDASNYSDDENDTTHFKSVTSSRLKFRSVRVKDVQISKLHSAVITTDPTNNLLVCGLATGGRLGLGLDSAATQYTYRAVPRFHKSKVISVALGLDHTLALTSVGVYTWGSNQFGQLGTNVDISKDPDNPAQYLPRKVNCDFGLEKIQGMAASRYHSVVFTDTQLFFWGKNIGQMGSLPAQDLYLLKKNPVCEDGGVIVPYPQVFPHLPSPVQMVAACDIATICLLQNSHVWVFMNGTHFRVQFPFKSASKTEFERFQPTKQMANEKIVKISCSSRGAVCAIDDHGIVYKFSLEKHYVDPAHLESSVKAAQIAKALKVKMVWDPKALVLSACDADIADDESVIICTVEGSVWKQIQKNANSVPGMIDITSVSTNRKKYHYEKVPFLNKVYQIRCDRLFSSFAAIRDDEGLKHLTVDEPDISDDFSNLVPFVGERELQMQAQYLARFSKRRIAKSFNRQKRQKDTLDLLLQNDAQFTVDRSLLTVTELDEAYSLREFSSHPLKSLFDTPLLAPNQYTQDHVNKRQFDILIHCADQDLSIPAHKFILLSRVPSLGKLIDGTVSELTGLRNLSITYDPTPTKFFKFGKLQISQDIQEVAVRVLVYYIYTDKYIRPWDEWKPPAGIQKNRAYEDFHRLLTTLNLENMKYSLNDTKGASSRLGEELLKGLTKAKNLNTDVEVVLQDGSKFLHSYILTNRSAFFATVLSKRWNDTSGSASGHHVVKLPHISKDVFELVVEYIYGDNVLNSFDTIGAKFDNEKTFVAFVLRVMDAASELTLVKLLQTCEIVIADFSKCFSIFQSSFN